MLTFEHDADLRVPHFPAAGEVVIFDRSWYNRAGLERVMGFCTEAESKRFLELVPGVERAMVDSGIVLINRRRPARRWRRRAAVGDHRDRRLQRAGRRLQLVADAGSAALDAEALHAASPPRCAAVPAHPARPGRARR